MRPLSSSIYPNGRSECGFSSTRRSTVAIVDETLPAGIWQGEPSGQRFAALLSERARQMGVQAAVDVVPLQAVGTYLVSIDWEPGPDTGLLCEVVDWVNGIRILDPHGEDVTVDQALAYFGARAKGSSPQEALRVAVPHRASWWRRHRERRQRRRVPFYGVCPTCGHDWREHPGGIFEPDTDTCGECEFEVDHDQRDTSEPPCRLPAPAPPQANI